MRAQYQCLMNGATPAHGPKVGKLLVLVAVLGAGMFVPCRTQAASSNSVVIHVKTALSVDDAQICAAPNLAWAAVDGGKKVTLVFDGSAVTSVARGYGWRGWFGITSTALDRAGLPTRERESLAKQFQVSLETVPRDYGEYLTFLKNKGVSLYYNSTMALLYKIEPEQMDPALTPLGVKEMINVLSSAEVRLVY